MTTLSLPTLRPRPLWRWRPTTQGVTTALILLFCGGLVGYPIVYLVIESFNTGDSETFPPESFGRDNYANVSAWISSSTELSAALALIQSAAVFIALIVLLRAARHYAGELP